MERLNSSLTEESEEYESDSGSN